MGHGDSTPILRVEWLIDSILFSERLPEIDFKIRSFKQPLTKSLSILDLKDVTYDTHQLSHTYINSYNDLNSRNLATSMPIQAPQLKSKPSKSISMPK